jgi:hypothetical protein
MKKTLNFVLAFFACCLLGIGSVKLYRIMRYHELPPDWQAIARWDLKGMYELIVENHPGIINQRDLSFVPNMQMHYDQALARIQDIKTKDGYRFLLEWFAHSFKDCHVWVKFDAKVQSEYVDWCGVIPLYKNGKYVVGYINSNWPVALPPVGAELIACDEKPVLKRMEEDIMAYANCLEHLEADKVKMAPRLLLDYGNPWCSRPAYATFDVNGKKSAYKLVWQNIAKAELTDKILSALGIKNDAAQCGFQQVANNGLWVSVPTFDPNADDVRRMQAMIERIGTFRNKSYVVFDIRGNGGGSDVYALNLLEQLYGKKYIRSVFDYYIEAFRVTEKNRLFFTELQQQHKGENALSDRLLASLVKLLESRAIDSLVILQDEENCRKHDDSAPLFTGKLFVVTDYACFSSSLNFMDMIKAIPGTIHIGLPTRADTKYCDIAFNELPSTSAKFFFPRAVVLNRKRPDNVPYIPDYRIDDIQNTDALQKWVVYHVKNH